MRDPVSGARPASLMAETGLVVFVPQAETLVQQYRRRHDTVAALGMPAHVTVFYPFKESGAITDDDIRALEELAGGIEAFTFELTEVGRFPGVLFLKPEPEEPFGVLARAIAESFPGLSMYEGEHRTFVPHLTVAHADDTRELDAIAGRFTREAEHHLPIQAYAGHVCLMESGAERWTNRRSFKLRTP